MLKIWLNVAVRSFKRNLTYSFINLAGLSTGIASTILILLWVHDELTFNSYFKNADDIHHVKINTFSDNGAYTLHLTPYPLRDVLQQDSRIKNVVINIFQSALLANGDKKIQKTGCDASDKFLEVFDYKMIYGDPKTALDEPLSIVLTESTAIALFGTADVVGKMVNVKIENAEDLKVTGVISDPPTNVTIAPNFIIPFSHFERTSSWLFHAKENWSNNSFEIYTELQPGVTKEEIDKSIADLVNRNSNDQRKTELFLHPMSHWRLYNNFENGKEAGGVINYVILFSIIAVLILAMACINFMNLATARSQHRAHEVGVRKSIGSTRRELIMQFMTESVMLSAAAFMIAIVFVELALPLYNSWVTKSLAINYAASYSWLFAVGLILITGVLAGSYPALYLSSFKPAKILKGTSATRGSSASRQVLVTTQFAFSILMVIGTGVVYMQIQHLKSRETGYNKENLLLIWSTSDIEKNFHPLKEELISTQAALSVTKSNSPITRIFASSAIESWPGMTEGQRVEATNIATEYDYAKTMGIRIVEGRDFSPEFRSDTAAMVINLAAKKAMGLEDPIGTQIGMWGQKWTVIGLIDDVLMGSSSKNIQPMVMTMDPTWSTTISVRIAEGSDVAQRVSSVETIFKKYNPDYPFEFRFADVEFQSKFSNINMVSRLSGTFALLALLITALGLLGLAAFTAEQRTKEIGIRKVLGATVTSVVVLITKDFAKLVVLSFLVAAPIGWWVASSFLEDYQVRIAIPYWIFPVAGAFALLITVIIVSTQAAKAAMNNPVDSLRSE